MRVDVVDDVLDVGGTKTSDGIPTLGGTETLAARRATIFSADVVTNSNVVEASRASNGHLVQEGVQETEGLAVLLEGVLVEDRDDTSPDRSRGRSTTDRLNTTLVDQDGVTNGGNIGVTTRGGVVVRSRRELNTRAQVSLDSRGLVRGHGGNVGETTTRSERSNIIRDGDFLATRRAGVTLTRANRGRRLEVVNGVVDLSGTNRGDVRASSGVVGLEIREGTVGIRAAVGSRVTRSDEEGQTTKSDLLEERVDNGGITRARNTELLANVGVNVALIGFGPAVRDGGDLGNILGGEVVGGPAVQPGIGITNPENRQSSSDRGPETGQRWRAG
jgi:hypothetical protein